MFVDLKLSPYIGRNRFIFCESCVYKMYYVYELNLISHSRVTFLGFLAEQRFETPKKYSELNELNPPFRSSFVIVFFSFANLKKKKNVISSISIKIINISISRKAHMLTNSRRATPAALNKLHRTPLRYQNHYLLQQRILDYVSYEF